MTWTATSNSTSGVKIVMLRGPVHICVKLRSQWMFSIEQCVARQTCHINLGFLTMHLGTRKWSIKARSDSTNLLQIRVRLRHTAAIIEKVLFYSTALVCCTRMRQTHILWMGLKLEPWSRVANSLLRQELKLCFSDTKFTKAPCTKKDTSFFLDTKWDTEQYKILSHTKIFWWY